MSNSVIGALRVMLGMDTAAFETGADRAKRKGKDLEKEMTQFGARMQKIGLAMTGAFAGVAVVFGDMVRTSVNAAVQLQSTAAALGMSVQEFQRAAYAARTVGVESENLADIFKDVSDKFGEFLQTGGGELTDFFTKIAPKVGVTAEQFRNLSGPQALQLYVSSLEKAGVNSQEMIFYLEALADDASRLAPLLANNGAEFKRLGDEAQRLGVVIDEQTSAAAQAFSTNLTRLNGVAEGLATRVAAGVLPALVSFTEWLLRNQTQIAAAAKATGEFVSGLFKLGQIIDRVGTALRDSLSPGVLDAIDKMYRMYKAASSLMTPLGFVITALRSLGRTGASMSWDSLNSMSKAGQWVPGIEAYGGAVEKVGVRLAGAGGAARGASAAMREMRGEADASASKLQSLLDRLYPAQAAARKLAEELDLIDKSGRTAAQKAQDRLKLRTEGFGPAVLSDWLSKDGPAGKLETLKVATDELIGSMAQLADKAEVQTVRVAESFADMAQNAIRSLQDIANAFKSGSFLDILQSVIGFGLQLGGMGVFGKGVQTRLQKTPGFASGGAMRLGGFGGVDRNVLSLNGTPIARVSAGETMQIRPANDRGASVVNNYYTLPSDEFWGRVDSRAGSIVSQSAPSIASAGAAIAQSQMMNSARRRIR